MRADGSLQSVGTRGLPTPVPLPPSQLCARSGLPVPRTGPTRPGHVAALGRSGTGPALGAVIVCWSGPRPAQLPTAQAARLCPARCSVLERGLPEDKECSVCFMQHAADKEQNTHSDRLQETARAGGRRGAGPFPASRPAGGLPGRGPLVPLTPGQGPAVSPGAGWERCGEGRGQGEEVGAVAWAMAQCGHHSLRRGPTWPRSF